MSSATTTAPATTPVAPTLAVLTTSNGAVFPFQKFVTLTCDLAPEKDAVIENPGGRRLKVRYKSDLNKVELVNTKLLGYASTGEIQSGGDWEFVRSDGVMFVDARVTIAFKKGTGWTNGDPVVLVDATLKGTIDLCKTFNVTSGKEAYAAFRDGTATPALQVGGVDCHYITGGLRFEVGGGAESWIAKNIYETSQSFGHFEPLVRQQFLAIGSITIQKRVDHYDAVQIVLEAWGVA